MKVKSGRKNYSADFKKEAARLVLEKGLSCRQVGADLGVADSLIARWVRQYQIPKESSADTEQSKYVRKLEAEVRRLRMESDILKKAMAYFAKTPE